MADEDLQTQLNLLKAKLEASQTVQSAVLAVLLKLAARDPIALLDAVRESAFYSGHSKDVVAAEDIKLAAEQFTQDAIDKIVNTLKNSTIKIVSVGGGDDASQ